jgi:hypothetical protein
MSSLPKHERYKDSYRPGDLYWGIGIENETYIELSGKAQTAAQFVQQNQKRERYSVDYWTLYNMDYVKSTIQAWIDSLPEKGNSIIRLPLLLNGHTLARCDIHGEHQTTYSKTPQPNPNFNGKTLLEELGQLDPSVFVEGRERWWTLDGDTVEFMTQDYYCAKMEDVIEELLTYKKRWLEALQTGLLALPNKEPALCHKVSYPLKNHGFAVFLTNRNNVAIFNNGTYHFNITLPTYLDKDARIANMEEFKEKHRAVARLFQWLSPFLVARYGSGDILANIGSGPGSFNKTNVRGQYYPAGSQRLCASRFVSVGTYDTKTMPPGKILTTPYVRCEDRWYEQIYDRDICGYNVLPELGMDINYNKHWNHGLEFRIFDWFPESLIPDVMRMLIWMCDEALLAFKQGGIPDPRDDPIWNRVLARTVWNGNSSILSEDELTRFGSVLHADLSGIYTISEIHDRIWTTWKDRWNLSTGTCTSYMIRYPLPSSLNRPVSDYRPVPTTAADLPIVPIETMLDYMYDPIINTIQDVLQSVLSPISIPLEAVNPSIATKHVASQTEPVDVPLRKHVWCCFSF